MGMVWKDMGNGRHVARYFPDGEEPETEEESEEAFEAHGMDHTTNTMVRQDIHFESSQLPRNHPSATEVNPKTGKPRFGSRYAAEEFVKRATDIGETVAYNEL